MNQTVLMKLSQSLPPEVKILPVSKGQTVESMRAFRENARGLSAFANAFGENYVGELDAKRSAFTEPLQWHYLGAVQSRKLADIAAAADVIHGIARFKELSILAQQPRRPKFYIQVNISNETQKNGCEVSELAQMAAKVTELGLTSSWVGLMGMAAPVEAVGEDVVRASFRRLRELRDQHFPDGGLSMGMSADFRVALEEGATLLRLGTLLFGERGATP